METDVVYFLGFFVTLIVLIGLSIYSGKKAGKKSGSFTGGGDSSAAIVAGAVIGTLVGGSSTVGTAQLAYNYGLSAWWFTLGGGIGCLIMAIWFVKPLRKKCDGTLTGLIAAEYGPKVGFAATILSSVGIYINIIAQLIAATAVIAIVIPGVNSFAAALIAALLMTLYVVFGGVKGTGIVGILKTVLLYVAAIGGGCIALKLFGGLQPVLDNPNFPHEQYLNLFARGIGKDLGAGVSLVLGVLSTQTYAQACLSGRSDSEARKGALISAFMIPPIGVGGILIGMYMKENCPDLVSAKMAFPQFVMEYMPSWLGGIVIATLLIAVVGTGAGLALGISTIISRDVVSGTLKKSLDEKKNLQLVRITIIAVLFSAALLTTGSLGDIILDFSFMSMGLRGAVLFVPLMMILFTKRKIASQYAFASVIAGPAAVLAGNFIIDSFDPLFIGIFVSLIIMIIGYHHANKSVNLNSKDK